MSGIGFSELIILFLIGLIVLGPERLPRVANQLGSWLGQARRMTRVMKRQLEEEIDFEGAQSIKPGASRSTPAPTTTEPPADSDAGKPAAGESVNTAPADEAQAPVAVDDPADKAADTPAAMESAQADKIDDTHLAANEFDDTYSPAHDADAPGTGVGDTEKYRTDAPVTEPADADDSTPAIADDKTGDATPAKEAAK